MMMLDTVFQFGPGRRLQWEETQRCFVILYPEGMVKLNPSAAEILKYCDGTKSVADIIQSLQEKFNESNLQTDIIAFLEDAYAKRWITKC